MVQIKKTALREEILRSAHALFQSHGFLECTMAEIAAAAGTSTSNLYVYFPSKTKLFYEVYMPILRSRMLRLAQEAGAIDDPRERLRFIFSTLWGDLPAEDNGFAHNLVLAVVTAPAALEKPRAPLRWCVGFINDLITGCLPPERHPLTEDKLIAFLSWMAFDGFAANVGREPRRDIERIAELTADMLLGRPVAAQSVVPETSTARRPVVRKRHAVRATKRKVEIDPPRRVRRARST